MDTHLPKQPYTLVFGTHPVVPHVLEELRRAGDPIVLVAPTKPAGKADDVEFIVGDPSDEGIVQRSEPARANRALIACTDDSALNQTRSRNRAAMSRTATPTPTRTLCCPGGFRTVRQSTTAAGWPSCVPTRAARAL